MARSVETCRDALHTFFLDATDLDGEFEWQAFEYDIIEWFTGEFKSFKIDRVWITDQTRRIVANGLIHVLLSEYMGCVAISIVKAPDANPNLTENWLYQTDLINRFKRAFTTYEKVATASNGESFYQLSR